MSAQVAFVFDECEDLICACAWRYKKLYRVDGRLHVTSVIISRSYNCPLRRIFCMMGSICCLSLLFSLGFRVTTALVLPPVQDIHLNATTSSWHTDNINPSLIPGYASSVQNVSDSTITINCNGGSYGRNLNIADCRSALNHITTDTTKATFSERTSTRRYDFSLPARQVGSTYNTGPFLFTSNLM